MSILVDTDILSRSAPIKKVPDVAIATWLESLGDEVHLSVVTLWELALGCEKLRLRGALAKARALQEWADDVTNHFRERTIDIDPRTAASGGRLLARAQQNGHDPGIGDALIAAQAERLGMRVATANVIHFVALGAHIIEPKKI